MFPNRNRPKPGGKVSRQSWRLPPSVCLSSEQLSGVQLVMNPKNEDSDKELMPLPGDAASQQLSETQGPSELTQLNPPRVDPKLSNLTPLERAAEVLRYSFLRAEYWLSPNGAMRQRVRFAM